MRVSNYNIYVPLKNQENEYIFFHGYSGAIDVVSDDIYNTIKLGEENQNILNDLSNEDKDVLKDRGYLTDLSVGEEVELFNKVADKISQFNQGKVFSISLVPTYGCNFRCPYCYVSKVIDKVDDSFNKIMSTSTVDSVIKCIKKKREEGKRVGGIGLCGGEPLLKESSELIEYLVEECVKNDLRLSAITNGHDLDHFKGVLGKGKIESLQITIDGQEDYHNDRRFLYGKKPTFKKIVSNIDWCLENDVRISVRSNIDESNVEQIEGLLSLFEEKGWLKYENFSHYFKGVNACFGEEEKESYIDDIKLMKILQDEKLHYHKYEYNNMYSFIKNLIRDAFISQRYPTIHVSHCSLPSNGAVIDPEGLLYPCLELIGKPEYAIGNLDEDGVINYNNNSLKWRNKTVNKIEQCSVCAYALYCGGGCPVKVIEDNGKIYSRNCDNFKTIFNEVVPYAYELYLKSEQAKGC